MALTLQQAKDEKARAILLKQEIEARLDTLNEYIELLSSEAATTSKNANALSKGTLENVRF